MGVVSRISHITVLQSPVSPPTYLVTQHPNNSNPSKSLIASPSKSENTLTASGQRTKPPHLSQRPEARHSLQMADREAHGLSVFRTLVAFLQCLIFFIRAGWGDRDG